MGRNKPGKPRRTSPNRSRLTQLADAYKCGHCHSEVGFTTERINIRHDDGCPVLAGALSDLPDAMRAAERAGGVVVADGSTGQVLAYLLPKRGAV